MRIINRGEAASTPFEKNNTLAETHQSTLRLNNTEVRTSFLTQRSFRAASCKFLVCVNPQNKNLALKAFADNKNCLSVNCFSGLHVSGIADLRFLSDLPDMRYLEIVDQKRVNTRYLDGLGNLRGLHLETPGAGIDFSCFPELEVYVGDWHADNTNVHRCQELRQLRIWQFKPKSLDLSELANITRLEWLTLTQTSITSLAGLETLEDLRYFEIAYASKLESLDAFAIGQMELRELEIKNAKKISSYEPLAALRRLRRLKLSACAPIPNLDWTNGLNQLDFLSFVETNVEDGDLSPLLRLPKLRYVGTMDKKHYNYRCDAINQCLRQRDKSDNRTDEAEQTGKVFIQR